MMAGNIMAVLAASAQSGPVLAIRNPAIEAPTIWAVLYVVIDRPTAVLSCSLCTSPPTSVCRAGMANANPAPFQNEIAIKCHGSRTSNTANKVTTTKPANVEMSAATIIFRLSSLSASTPPNNDRNSMGSIMPATTNATRNGDPVNCSMSQPLVSICMEKAVKVRKPAVQYMRNWPDLITPNGWSLRIARTGRPVRDAAAAVLVGPVTLAVLEFLRRRRSSRVRRDPPAPDPPTLHVFKYPPTDSVTQAVFLWLWAMMCATPNPTCPPERAGGK